MSQGDLDQQADSESSAKSANLPLDRHQVISWGKNVCKEEALAIEKVSKNLGETFFHAVKTVLSCQGKTIITGLGKSGYIARKMASTLSSTGTPSFYLHPTEALHGDFGMLQKNDCLIAIAHGGETREVVGVANFARAMDVPVISITGNMVSTLSKLATYSLDGSIEKEADTLGLAPTASSTVALAICDALSVAVMKGRGFTSKDFAFLHPGGSLGKRFALVSSYYQKSENLKTVSQEADFHAVVEAITSPNYGIIAVLSEDKKIVGAISDGDLRRSLLKHKTKALELSAKDIMSSHPLLISEKETVMDAVAIMEEKSVISLFVSENNKFLGLIRLHDLIASKII